MKQICNSAELTFSILCEMHETAQRNLIGPIELNVFVSRYIGALYLL